MLYGELYDAAMFVVTEGGGLPGSAAGSEAVDVSFDEVVEEPVEGRLVN
jgi:hypothetical protein